MQQPAWKTLIEKARRGLVWAAVFLLPFHHKLLIHYPRPDLLQEVVPAFASAYLNISDAALLAAFLLSAISDGRRLFSLPRRLCWLLLPTLGLAALAFISAFWAPVPVLAVVLGGRLLLMAGLVLMARRSDPDALINAVAASAAINAILGLAQYAIRGSVGLPLEVQATADPYLVPVVEADGIFYLRVYGFTAHPNILAAYLAAAILLVSGRTLARGHSTRIDTLVTGLAGMGLGLTFSRAAWAGLALGGAALVSIYLIQPALRPRLRALRDPALAGLLVVMMAAATQSRQIGLRFSPTASQASTSDRILLTEDALSLLEGRWPGGVGGHNFSAAAAERLSLDPAYSGAFRWQPVHNFTLLATAELGLPGGAAWLWLTTAPWLTSLRRRRQLAVLIASSGWLAVSLLLAWNGLWDHFAWSLPEGMGLMWLAWAGLGMALDSQSLPEQPQPRAAEPLQGKENEQKVRFWADRNLTRDVLPAFMISRLALALITGVAGAVLPLSPGSGALPPPVFPDNAVPDGLVRWNSFWYAGIAQNGYAATAGAAQSSAAILPAYPFLIRLMTPLTGSPFTAGLLASNLALLAGLAYLYALARYEMDSRRATRAVMIAALAPASIFLSAMYPDSLAFACIAATLYYARRGRWLPAALAGLLAGLTHGFGLLLPAAILAEGLLRQGVRFRKAPEIPRRIHLAEQIRRIVEAWKSLLAGAAIWAGFAVHALLLGRMLGDPLAVLHTQAGWGRDFSGLGLLRLTHNTLDALPHTPFLWIDLLAAAGFGALAVLAARRLRPALGIYAALTWLAPLFTGSILSMTRLSLLMIPAVLILADGEKGSWTRWLWPAAALPLMGLIAALFSRWYWVG